MPSNMYDVRTLFKEIYHRYGFNSDSCLEEWNRGHDRHYRATFTTGAGRAVIEGTGAQNMLDRLDCFQRGILITLASLKSKEGKCTTP